MQPGRKPPTQPLVTMLLAADNLTAAHPLVAAALKDRRPQPLQDLARRCQAAGAHLLDLNPGYLGRHAEDGLAFMVQAVQEAVVLPLMLDSPQPQVLSRAVAVCRRKPLLNALTLEESKLREILPLAVRHDTDLVVLLLDEHSHPPPTLEGKLALAATLRQHALAAGLAPEHLIFDPVIPNLRWPEAYRHLGVALQTVRLLASGAFFGEPVRTMAGLSNCRSGVRHLYPPALDALLLALLAGAGLDLALVDVLQPPVQQTYQTLRQMI